MTLVNGVLEYIEWKRGGGVEFKDGATRILAFVKYVGELDLGEVRKSHVLSYLDSRQVTPTTWRERYFMLRSFFEYCYARGYISLLPMPENRSASAVQFIPHIYTKSELRRLLRAIVEVQDGRTISPETFRMLVLFLYSTGAGLGETFRLRRSDFNFKKKIMTFPAYGKHSSRTIPIGTSLNRLLRTHFLYSKGACRSAPFFVNSKGRMLSRHTIKRIFQEVREKAGIRQSGGTKREPTLHDLRHTFAVHRVAAWLKEGADLSVLLPALSVYLGQIGLSSTERYFRLTPESFRQQLSFVATDAGRPKWIRDQKILHFLDNL